MTDLLPVVPDPTLTSVDALHQACLTVREWVDDCDNIPAAVEVLARVAAIEEYLSRRGQEGPAQEAARWLEVRIGDLLGPASPNGKGDVRVPHEVPKNRVHEFRKLAAHRDLVADMVPASRRRILHVIRQTEVAQARPPTEPPKADTTTVTYPTVVIDPPWRYDNVATRGAAADHYPTMSLDELAALHIPSADDSHLYLWVTAAFLRDGFNLLDAWGFTYKTILTWCKPSIGMGNYFRVNTEHVLFATRGRQPTLRNDVGTWFEAPRTKHSAKPESFYDLVESCSPGPWLEMFARRRRFGWHTWGNEA
jgi:N6-adenosine-specific RNA methylase IME4